MKNILFVGANKDNATDGVIVRGIYNLIDYTFPENKKTYINLRDTVVQDEKTYKLDDKFDFLVVSGTPWLWDQFQNSTKYKNLATIFSYYKDIPKIFMGAGSSMLLRDMSSNILERPSEVKGIKDLYGGTKVFARDSLAQKKFLNANIQSTFLPCPAYFCYGISIQKSQQFDNNVLVWCDPRHTISSIGWKEPHKFQQYQTIAYKFYQTYKPSVACAFPVDVKSAKQMGFKNIILLSSPDDTLSLMINANHVLSGRVHCAVPAFVQGKKLQIMEIDSRAKVLTDFGCKPATLTSLKNIDSTELDLVKFADQYKKEILEFLP